MQEPKRLRHADSFLGIHFDFHAAENSQGIGKRTTREMIEYIIDQVQPDYIQCDCKGHPGISSYPTKVGTPASQIHGDPLRIWREVTAERGVGLYMHYSGVWDDQAVKLNPSWALTNAQGAHDPQMTSVFGPYVDELLIPQLKELSDVYGVDGVWVDGDCWATRRDYGAEVVTAFREATGIEDVPLKPEDPYFFEFSEFCREGFRRYLRHYVDTLHAHNPTFQVTSNWAFSSQMPEPISAQLDFLSGDYSLANSLNSARLEGRCLAHQGKAWDLMAWSFAGDFHHDNPKELFSTKSIPQLQREAAIVLALGGGFQAYFQQARDGAIFSWQMQLMHEVAQFCRARQASCHRAISVPQVALLYASSAHYRQTSTLFGNDGLDQMSGVLQALLDGQQVVDILMEHQIKGHSSDYPLIVIPEWSHLANDLREELLVYVHDGGNLLLIGPKTAALFEQELNITLVGEPQGTDLWLEQANWLAGLRTLAQEIQVHEGSTPFGRWYPDNDLTLVPFTAASIASYGKGKIATTSFNLGEVYIQGKTSVPRDFLNALVHALFPDPLVKVSGSHLVDVTLNRIDDKLAVNLVNTGGPHADKHTYVFDEIPSIGPLEITIRSEQPPQKVMWEPAGTPLPFIWEDKKISVTLPSLELHDIIIVE
jgi:hypothetical protein